MSNLSSVSPLPEAGAGAAAADESAADISSPGASLSREPSRSRAASLALSLSSSSLSDPEEYLGPGGDDDDESEQEQQDDDRRSTANTTANSSALTSDDDDESDLTENEELEDPEDAREERERDGGADLEDEELDEGEDEDFTEVGKDGEDTPITKIKALLKDTPDEPKHRWETAYVYAFMDRFTSVAKDSPHSPQTVQEFERALVSGRGLVVPESMEEEWLPSLEPLFKDFVERLRNQDLANGGTGGMRGGWQAWLPWWIKEQREAGLSDFAGSSTGWARIINELREDKDGIWTIDWDKRLIILKVLVDAQLCIVKDIKVRIDESYGYGVAALREKQQHQHQHQQEAKQAKLEGRKEQAAGTSSSAGEKEKVTVASATVTPATATVPATPKEAENPLLIRPIGQDTREYLWFRIDDSPRLYVNNNPHSARQSFVAVTDTAEEVEAILKHLAKPPPPPPPETLEGSSKGKGKGKAKGSSTSKASKRPELKLSDNPFSKASAAAAATKKQKKGDAKGEKTKKPTILKGKGKGKVKGQINETDSSSDVKGKGKGRATKSSTLAADPSEKKKQKRTVTRKEKPKPPRLTRKQRNLQAEQQLYAYIFSVLLPSVTGEESPYLARVAKFQNRRNNILRKKEREARAAQLAAERAALEQLRAQGIPTGIRSSTRLRRGPRPDYTLGVYNEKARDDELEAVIQESEKNHARKRRRLSRDDGGADSEDDDDDDQEYDFDDPRRNDENDMDVDDDDDFDDSNANGNDSRRSSVALGGRRSSRHGLNNGRGNAGSADRYATDAAPGGRRSQRARTQVVTNGYAPEDFSREASLERGSSRHLERDENRGTSSRPAIVRSYSPEPAALVEETPFGGLEEIWSKGKYLGFYTVTRQFIPAKKGDIPLYKLIRMGKELPDPYTGKFADAALEDQKVGERQQGQGDKGKSDGSGAGETPSKTEDTPAETSQAAPTLATDVAATVADDAANNDVKPVSHLNGKVEDTANAEEAAPADAAKTGDARETYQSDHIDVHARATDRPSSPEITVMASRTTIPSKAPQSEPSVPTAVARPLASDTKMAEESSTTNGNWQSAPSPSNAELEASLGW